MDLGLKDMRVLVAASSQGLGAATAVQCALEGARVTINGRDPAKLAKTAAAMRDSTNADILAIPGDIARAEDVRRVVDDAATQMGGIDILVTNCGGPPGGGFEQITPEQWQGAFNLVLMSAVNLMRVALPIMRLSDSPSILAITSVSVKEPVNNLLLSNSVRMSVAGLVKTLANELGPRGIRVNGLMPGYTRTDRVTQIVKNRAENEEKTVQEVLKDMTATIPLGRMGEPEEFGRVAAFVVSPAASYIHGTMIAVDGGSTHATL